MNVSDAQLSVNQLYRQLGFANAGATKTFIPGSITSRTQHCLPAGLPELLSAPRIQIRSCHSPPAPPRFLNQPENTANALSETLKTLHGLATGLSPHRHPPQPHGSWSAGHHCTSFSHTLQARLHLRAFALAVPLPFPTAGSFLSLGPQGPLFREASPKTPSKEVPCPLAFLSLFYFLLGAYHVWIFSCSPVLRWGHGDGYYSLSSPHRAYESRDPAGPWHLE